MSRPETASKQASPEERAERAERALAEALAERNRLWGEVQRLSAAEQDAEHWRRRAQAIEATAWWRAGWPIRMWRWAQRNPGYALRALADRFDR